MNPDEARITVGCVIVVLACRSVWTPYSSLFKEVMLCLLLIIIGIWVFIVSPTSFHHNFKRIRWKTVDGNK